MICLLEYVLREDLYQCDVTLMDNFHLSYVKTQVYKNNPQLIKELRDKIMVELVSNFNKASGHLRSSGTW